MQAGFPYSSETLDNKSKQSSLLFHPIDRAHEQVNKRVRGVREVIRITENPEMLERWIATDPEICRVLEQSTDVDDDGGQELKHHEEERTCLHRYIAI